MTGHIGHVICHLGSLLGAVEFIVLCVFVCKVGFFDAQIKDTPFDLLVSFGKMYLNSLHGIKV